MSGRPRSFLAFLFFASGISGLVFETVWLRMLTRILGSTVYATSVILGAYMAGLALGSFLLGRMAGGAKRPLRLYAALEGGVGAAAFALTALIPALVPLERRLSALAGGSRGALTVAQSLVMFALLLVPTALMGGTLPVLAEATRDFGVSVARRMGLLYGINTLGAVAGVLGCGLAGIGILGERGTVLVGVLVNLLVALLALRLSGAAAAGSRAPGGEAPSPGIAPAPRREALPWIYAASGFAAIAYEVVWTRVFQIQLGTSIYAFSTMLAAYLLGIGAGSLAGGRLMDRAKDPMRAFVAAQAFIAFHGVAGMFISTWFVPVGNNPELTLGNALAMPLLVVTPLTFALGFLFPALSRAYSADPARASRDIGTLYAFNTAGCIAGSLVTGFVLLDLAGSRGTLLLLAGLNAALAWAGLAFMAPGRRVATWAKALGAATLAGILALPAAPDPFRAAVARDILRRYGPAATQRVVRFDRETAQATTTAFSVPTDLGEFKQLWVNGIGMTVLCTETKIMAHLPLLLHPRPRSLLAVCFGMGTTFRSAARHPGLRCEAVELDPDVYACFPIFHADARALAARPDVALHADDGRNFLLCQDRAWDVITMDPPPPVWASGTANLQSREYFQLCRDHLAPGGIFCLWLPPASLTEGRMVMATFLDVFPSTWVFRGPRFQGLYLVGFKGPSGLDPAVFRARLSEPGLAAIVQADLREWDDSVPSPSALLDLLVLDPASARAFVRGSRLITDDHPYNEFPLWRSLRDPAYRVILDGSLLMRWKRAGS